MRWLRQHCEGGRVILVVRVSNEKAGYTITLLEPGRTPGVETIATSYASRETAFGAADAIVRSRYGAHACGSLCSGWTEDAETR